MEDMINLENIGTYMYRGKDYLYDQIIVSDNLLDSAEVDVIKNSVSILDLDKYRQQEGKYKRYPFRFWAGNKLLGGYSDHLAVKVNFVIK